MKKTILFLLLAASPADATPLKLFVLRDYPTLGISSCLVIDGGGGKKIDLPNLAFLIDHPKGLTLIDAGYGSRFGEIKKSFPSSLFYSFIRVDTGRECLRGNLKKMGIAPESIKHLILTHLHLDHAGGAIDFPNAEVIVGKTEWEENNHLPGFIRESIAKRLKIVDLAKGKKYFSFDKSVDLFGDDSLVMVSTPGHTPGHSSLFLKFDSGKRFLLAGDVAWIAENYLRPARKGWFRWMLEPRWKDEALFKIHRLAEDFPEIKIIPSHDPTADQELLRPPAYYE
ncbi:MAG TPA: hypothetical protein DD435_01335 [Cyanobacteria bacterium UBA8530]|nr:hypothetical protein [Cyanobacteria bacterium UBA8530]